MTLGYTYAAPMTPVIVYDFSIPETVQRNNIRPFRQSGVHPTYQMVELWNNLEGMIASWGPFTATLRTGPKQDTLPATDLDPGLPGDPSDLPLPEQPDVIDPKPTPQHKDENGRKHKK